MLLPIGRLQRPLKKPLKMACTSTMQPPACNGLLKADSTSIGHGNNIAGHNTGDPVPLTAREGRHRQRYSAQGERLIAG